MGCPPNLSTKSEHMDIVEKLCPVELKPPVLKTLTVIALKEPIRQSLLKEIRGSNAYEHVQELIEKGLVKDENELKMLDQNISEIKDLPNDKMVTICGLITSVKLIPYKNDPSKALKTFVLEDLSGKIDVICFHQKLANFGDFLKEDNKVMVTGKKNSRSESEFNVLLHDVKPVDNANMFMISINDKVSYEELVAMKDILAKYPGFDPVILKLEENGVETKIVSSQTFWVNASYDLEHSIKRFIPNKISVEIKSIAEKL